METTQVIREEILSYQLENLLNIGIKCSKDDIDKMVIFAVKRADELKNMYNKEYEGFGDKMWGAFFEDGLVIGRFIGVKYHKSIIEKLHNMYDNDIVNFVKEEMKHECYSKRYN